MKKRESPPHIPIKATVYKILKVKDRSHSCIFILSDKHDDNLVWHEGCGKSEVKPVGISHHHHHAPNEPSPWAPFTES